MSRFPSKAWTEAARISARQFARLFLKETGDTPARAVERLRAEVALPRVQEGTEPIEMIARNVGFGDRERMRRAFLVQRDRTEGLVLFEVDRSRFAA